MWQVPQNKLMTKYEVVAIADDLRRRGRRAKTTLRNLVIFRLATSYGLRVSEICGLRLGDIRFAPSNGIYIPASIGKGSKARRVSLVWDIDAMPDLERWVAVRRGEGAIDTDLLVTTRDGRKLSRFAARAIFVRACKRVIGREVTIHGGRHTFVSYALIQRPAVAVRDAAGHAHLSITNIYAHVVEPDITPGKLFDTALST